MRAWKTKVMPLCNQPVPCGLSSSLMNMIINQYFFCSTYTLTLGFEMIQPQQLGALRDGPGLSATWVRLYTLGTIQVVSLRLDKPFAVYWVHFYLPAGLRMEKLKVYGDEMQRHSTAMSPSKLSERYELYGNLHCQCGWHALLHSSYCSLDSETI